jgi:hypothetical protein
MLSLISRTHRGLRICTRIPFGSFLIEFQLFSKRMEIPSLIALPRIGVFKGKNSVYFMYFSLILILFRVIHEKKHPIGSYKAH